MAYQIQLRNDIANNWTRIDPVLAQAEAGYENDTGQLKFGDGVTPWTSLPYFSNGGGNGGGTPGGVNGSIQYNNNGAFGGSGLFQLDVANGVMTITGNVNAGYFVGDGSQLTNLPTSNLANITGNLIPSANGIYSLGNATNQWKDLWVTSNTIFIDTIPIGLNSNSDLTFNGNPLVTAEGNTGVTNVAELVVQGNIGANNVAAQEVIATGNIQANYIWANNYVYANAFIGEGGNLSNIQYANIVGAYSNANVADYLPGYAGNLIVEELGATANISAQYYFGNIAYTTGGFGNSNIADFLPTYTGNLSANNIAVSNNFAVHGDASISGNLNVAGNTVYTNTSSLTVDDPIIVAGANNVSDIIDQGLLTPFNNGTQQYGGFIRDHLNGTWNLFANVTTLPNTTVDFGNAVYVPLRAGTFIGDGGNLSNINAANIVGDIALSNANVSGSMTVGGNIAANGNITTTGAVVASYLVGDGSNITNIPYSAIVGGYGDANVAAYLPSYTGALNSLAGNVVTTANIRGANIIATGNVYSQYVYGNGAFLTGITAGTSYSNANVEAFLPTNTGNVAAAYFIGDGSLLTNIASGYSNANVAAYLPTYTGNVQAGSFTTGPSGLFIAGNTITTHSANLILDPGFDGLTGGTVYIQGNLNVTGNTSYTNVTVATTSNLVWQAAYNANTPLQADGGGLAVGPVANSYASFLYDVSTNAWISSISGTFAGNLTADYLKGDGGYISNIQYANIIDAYGDSNVAAYLPTNTSDVAAGNIYTGDLSATGYASLTIANVSGNLAANAILTDNYLYANGVPVSFGGGGTDYSNANVAAYLADGNLVTDVTTTANVTANYVFGNIALATGGYSNTDVEAFLANNTGGNSVSNNVYSNTVITNDLTANGSITANGVVIGNGVVTTNTIISNTVNTTDVVANGNITADQFFSNTVTSTTVNTTDVVANGNVTADQFFSNTVTSTTVNTTDVVANGNITTNGVTIGNGVVTTNSVVSNTFTGGAFSGDGSNLSNIQYSSIVGAYGNANVADYLPTYAGDILGDTVTANYFYGDGSNLTNINAGNLVGGYSNTNAAAYLANSSTTGDIFGGIITAADNVQSNLYLVGTSGALAEFNSAVVLAAQDAANGLSVAMMAGNATGTDSDGGTVAIFAGAATGNGNPGMIYLFGETAVSGANLTVTESITSDGIDANVATISDIISSNLIGALDITASGNITANDKITAGYFYGDGSNITNINASNLVGGYSNSNVADYLPTYTGNISAGNIYVSDSLEVTDDIISTGNVSAVAFIGNGNQLSNINIANIAGSYANSNVAAYLPTNTANINAAVVTATLFSGNGSQISNINISNIAGSYSNSNVAAYLPFNTSNIQASHIFATDVNGSNAITGNVLIGSNGVYTSNMLGTGTVTANSVVANLSVTANTVTANYLAGDGSNITNINAGNLVGGYGNANVAAYLPTYGGNLAANVVTANAAVINGNTTISGNLTVTGNIDYTNVQDLVVGDPMIFTGANNTSDIVDLGMVVQYNTGTTQYGGVVRNHTNGYFTIFEDLATAPTTTVDFANANLATVQAGFFAGNGSLLSNINIANIAGSYSNSNVATYLPTYTGLVTAGNANITGGVTAAYFAGDAGNLSNVPTAATIALGTSNIVIQASGNVTGSIAGNAFINVGNTSRAVALGIEAGQANQSSYGVAIGSGAGQTTQGAAAVAIGQSAGQLSQGAAAVAIGKQASQSSQGTGAIAIGSNSVANSQAANSVVINASGSAITAAAAGLYAAPVRNDNSNTSNVIFYNVSTKELTYAAMPPSYANANVAAYLPIYNGNIAANVVTANYFVGDGSQLSNLNLANASGGYGNAQVAAYLTVYGGNIAANVVTANLFVGNGSQISNINIANIAGSYANSNVAAYLPTNAANINAAVVTATLFSGNGSQISNINISNIAGSYANSNVTAYLPTYTGNLIPGNITVTYESNLGNIANVTITGGSSGQVVITDGAGNLSFGNVFNVIPAVYFTANTTGNNQTFSNTVLTAYSANTDMSLFYNGSLLEASYYTLSGDTITVNTPLITGDSIDIIKQFAGTYNTVINNTYGNANVAAYLPTYTGNAAAGNVTVTGLFTAPQQTKASTATGTVGQICWDANYIYVCTATNTWKRTALTGGY